MRINHNIQALNAYRQLSKNQGIVSKHLEKLSSGLRINRAADDAAGLAISEKMRSQIRGLTMAERNALDGISLIQTAEGALGTTHEILQRMRELAVQAANGTLDDEDRAALQAEIDQLTLEVDRIAKTTQFNAKPLLRGAVEGRPFASANSNQIAYKGNGTWEGIVTADATSKASVELNLDFSFGSLAANVVDGQTFTINGITYELDVAGGTAGVTAGNVSVNIGTWQAGGTDTDAALNVDAVLNALKSAIMANDPTFDNSASTITQPDNSSPGNGVFEANGTLVLKTVNTLTPDQADNIAVSTTATGANFYEEGTTNSTTKLIGDPNALNAKTVNIDFAEVPGDGDVLIIDNITINFGTTASTYDPATNSATIDITGKTIYDVLSEIDAILTTAATDSGAIPAVTSHSVLGNSLILSTAKTDDGGTFGSANGLEIRFTDNDFEANAGKELKVNMQIGANSSENMDMTIGVMDAASLGIARQADHTTIISTSGVDAIAGVNISTQDAAKAAIDIFDQAIQLVSEQRSKLGAYQNRMEHTINNLSLTNENLTAAESRIRDTDMAMEMTNFTKANIINQAAQAMLAQANQLPQGILQLLK